MDWTDDQRATLAAEYARIGMRADERIPFPADPRLAQPAAFLALLGAVPDGSGLAGYLGVLRRHAGPGR